MKRIIVALLLVGGLTGCDASQVGGPDGPEPVPVESDQSDAIQESPVIAISNGGAVGDSRLGRDEDRVGVIVRTAGIPNDQALTLWWVVFNNPEACATTPCDEPDLFNPDVEADVLYAAGSVVSNGVARFNATRREGDRTGSIAHLFEMPAASGLHDAETAEVHVIVRSHGPAIPDILDRQLGSFDGGCTVELAPGTIPSKEGECADLQFAIHQADPD